MRPIVPARHIALVAIVSCGLTALSLAGKVIAQSVVPPALSATQTPVSGHNLVSLDYSVRGPIGGQSLSIGPDRVAQIQIHNRYHRPMQRSFTVEMSPAQFRHMIVLINSAGLAQLPARVGRRIMDGGVVTVSVTYDDPRHQAQTVTVVGGDPALNGLSQLQEFLGDFLNAHSK